MQKKVEMWHAEMGTHRFSNRGSNDWRVRFGGEQGVNVVIELILGLCHRLGQQWATNSGLKKFMQPNRLSQYIFSLMTNAIQSQLCAIQFIPVNTKLDCPQSLFDSYLKKKFHSQAGLATQNHCLNAQLSECNQISHDIQLFQCTANPWPPSSGCWQWEGHNLLPCQTEVCPSVQIHLRQNLLVSVHPTNSLGCHKIWRQF